MFFTNRIEGYDEHMLGRIRGVDRAYALGAEVMAGRLSEKGKILDLGCGTGLQLDYIWELRPDLQVTDIDMTQAMLDVLQKKHPARDMTLICGSYFDEELGCAQFDAAVSYESLHHFTAERKLGLYQKLHAALKPGGFFLDGDKVSETQTDEEESFAEYARIKSEQGLDEDTFFHFDTPLTVEHETALLLEAGFSKVTTLMCEGTVAVILAEK